MTQIKKLRPAGPDKNGIIPVVRNPEEIEKEEIRQESPKEILKKDIIGLNKVAFAYYKKKEIKLARFDNVDITETEKDYPMRGYQPLQFTMRSSIRYYKKNYKECIVGVTPHFIFFIEVITEEQGTKAKYIGNIHVMEVKKMFHGINYEKVPFLQIRLISQMVNDKKVKLNATFTNPSYEIIQEFTRIVYRNVSLAYANLDDDNVNLRPKLSFDPNLYKSKNISSHKQQFKENFPSFDEFISKKLSPSQRFQFTYAANCSHDWIPYNHAVVENFHAQVINSNGVFNAGLIPIKTYKGAARSLYEMIPVFRSLIYTQCIIGVVCDDTSQPDILKAVSYQLIKSSNLKLLHLSKVQAAEGLFDLYNNISCNTNSCGVIYFDFSGNPNLQREIIKKVKRGEIPQYEDSNPFAPDPPSDASQGEYPPTGSDEIISFFDVFKEYKTKVIYISFNDCDLKAEHLNELFKAMQNYPSLGKLKYLHISRSELFAEPRNLFKDYLATHQNLVSLDIGNMYKEVKDSKDSKNSNDAASKDDYIEDVIRSLHHQPLERLYLYKNTISERCYESLKNLIDACPLLSVLDISDTGLNAEQVSRIIDAMSSRLNSRMLTIKASNLRLNGSSTLTIMKGFLNGQLDRWDTIYLNSNGMRTFDLQMLVPLFQQMVNLRELSLSDNFDNDMQGIEYELCNLLRIPGLRILRLGGPLSQDRILGNKIKPFLFSVALSYQIRNKIGGLAMKNREKDQVSFSKEANGLIAPKLEVKEDEIEGYAKYLQKKFDHILRPFLLEKKKEEAAELFKTEQGNEIWRQMFREMINLIDKCRGIYTYDKNDIRKKTIADRTMEVLNQWTIKFSIANQTPNTSMESEIIKACSAEDKKQWIDMAANLAHLKYLDLKDVKIDLSVITALLKVDRELRGIEIDGCDIKTVGSVVDFVDTVEEQPNLIKIPFPKKDMEKLIKECEKNCKEAGQIVREDMDDLRQRLMRTINKHRFRLSDQSIDEEDIPEYPYETIPEIQKLLQEKRAQKTNLRSHNGICEDFNMQLPYLSMDRGLPDDYYLDDDDLINKMCVYEFQPYNDETRLPEKSIAIQKRYDEVDDIDFKKEEEDTHEEEEIIDDSEAWQKISQKVQANWNFFHNEDQTEIVQFESEDETKEEESDDDPKYVPPPFEKMSSKKKGKLYQRPKKEISFDESDEDSIGKLKKYNINHPDLKGKLQLKKPSAKLLNHSDTSEIQKPPD